MSKHPIFNPDTKCPKCDGDDVAGPWSDGRYGNFLEYSTDRDVRSPWYASAWQDDWHSSGDGNTPREALYRLLLEVRG